MPSVLGTLYSRTHASLASPSMLPLPTPSKSWESVARRAQDHRDATVASVDPPIPNIAELPLDSSPVPKTILTSSEISITESKVEDLISKLQSGELTSLEVTRAFLRRAALAQKLTNCITELLPDAALERAAFLDDYLKKNGKPIGPLHGLPISVKEHMSMKGLTVNAGFIAWHDQIAPANAHILDLFLTAGAVFYVRTTEPRTLMHLETSSNFFGTTVNPFNRNLTSGGSSGGEGALIGMRGSCLGIGTDIGGSIRSPAANNGLYGLRPTSYRLPLEGLMATMIGQEHIVPVIGPMSTSLEGVKLFMKTLIDAKPWIREPSLVPLPWKTMSQLQKNSNGERKLKVGVMYDDGVVRPHPPVLRALRTMADSLKGVPGIEVVDWKPYKHDYAWDIIASLYFCDGGREEIETIAASGEPWRPMSKFILTENKFVKNLTIKEMWYWTSQRDAYRAEYSQLWGDIDVVLCPVGPGVAPLIETARYWGYTSQWNLLDYPALVAPVTKVDPRLDVADPDYVPRNEKDKYNHDLYESEKYKNAPVSIQLVGKRYEDEKVIEAMEVLIETIGMPFSL